MNKELVIDSTPGEVVIALLNDRRLLELHREKRNNSFSVGDVYLGRVKKIMPGLNAAFIDVGYEKDAFLHYLDLGPQFASFNAFSKRIISGKFPGHTLDNFKLEPDIEKTGKITQVLTPNQPVLVQIAKEPISSKGPRITSEISIPGRYMVLVPFSDKVSVSQKIRNPEERERLKKLVNSIRPLHFGFIVRTVAENKGVSEIESDIQDLMSKWKELCNLMTGAAVPAKLHGELDRTSAILRDLLNDSFSSIQVNDQGLFDEMRTFLGTIAPGKLNILKLYKGKVPVFDHFGIERQIRASFGRNVTMRSGAYLVVEHTEAMHVIDVNSGTRSKSDGNQDQNALEVNLEAAAEVARQLRLRDMGGIIVVDFIDLVNPDSRKLLYDRLKDEMATDRAKHQILPPTKFGLVQITRQRVRPEMSVKTAEKCPACNGSGEIGSTVTIIDEIEAKLKFIMKEQNEKKITLSTNPYLAAFFSKGLISPRVRWFMRYKKWIHIRSVDSYTMLEYRFVLPDGQEIAV